MVFMVSQPETRVTSTTMAAKVNVRIGKNSLIFFAWSRMTAAIARKLRNIGRPVRSRTGALGPKSS